MLSARISPAGSEEIAKTFHPAEFDADARAGLARNAGMRHLVITARHHDGCAMFGSRADRLNIVDATPFGRAPVRELTQARAPRSRPVARAERRGDLRRLEHGEHG